MTREIPTKILLSFCKHDFGIIYPKEVDMSLNKETKSSKFIKFKGFLLISHSF